MLTIDSFNFARAVICHLFSFLDRTPFTDTFWFCTHLPQDIGLLRSHITTPLVGLLLHQVSTSHTARTREQENQACCLPASLIASPVLTHRIELAYETFDTSIKVRTFPLTTSKRQHQIPEKQSVLFLVSSLPHSLGLYNTHNRSKSASRSTDFDQGSSNINNSIVLGEQFIPKGREKTVRIPETEAFRSLTSRLPRNLGLFLTDRSKPVSRLFHTAINVHRFARFLA